MRTENYNKNKYFKNNSFHVDGCYQMDEKITLNTSKISSWVGSVTPCVNEGTIILPHHKSMVIIGWNLRPFKYNKTVEMKQPDTFNNTVET